jgi:hypothetical protein
MIRDQLPDLVRIVAGAQLVAVRFAAPWALRVTDLSKLVARLGVPRSRGVGTARPARDPTPLLVALEPIERALRRAGRAAPDTCLYRSLARYAALSHAGAPVRFVMGVYRNGDELVGHAWLEYDNRPLGETVDPRFVVTFAHP